MLQMIVTIALRFLFSYLESRQDKKESNQRFLEFLDAMRREGLTSVKLADSAEAQLERLRKLKEQIDAGIPIDAPKADDISALKLIAPKEVKAGVPFQVTITGLSKDYTFGIHLFAERKHFLTSAQPPNFSPTIKLNSTGPRVVGFEAESGVWVEAQVNVVENIG